MTAEKSNSPDQWLLFRRLCSVLAGRDAIPGQEDPEGPWLTAFFFEAAERGLLPALATRLAHEPAPVVALQPQIAAHLQQSLLLNTRRNMQITAQALKLARCLNREGIAPLFLKGTALLLDTARTPLGFRRQLDIDVIVPAAQLPRACQAMLADGYRYLGQPGDADRAGLARAKPKPMRTSVHDDNARALCDSRYHHHLPPMIKEGYNSPVELHRSHLPRRFQADNPTGPLFSAARNLKLQGAEFLLPAIEHQIIQLVLGSFLHDGYAARYDLCLRSALDYGAMLEEPTRNPDVALLRRQCGKALAVFHTLVIELMGFNPKCPIGQPADIRWRLGMMQRRMNSPELRQWLDKQARLRHLGRSMVTSSGKLPAYLRRQITATGQAC
jgi:hypothetical protein